MKKIVLSLFLLSSMAMPIICSATEKTITVEWSATNANTIGVQNYMLYYSPISNSQGTVVQTCGPWQETGDIGTDPKRYSMTCNNVPIISTLSYFTLIAVTSENEVVSNVFTLDTRLSPIQNFTILTPSANIPPTAKISATATSGNVPLTVTFDASNSSDSDGNIVSYSWNFGDESLTETTSTPNNTHTYTDIGSYHAALTVTDDRGEKSQPQSIPISVSETPTILYAINFQPQSSIVPNGFIADSGALYNSERRYGWSLTQIETRERNLDISPDKSYDTSILTNSSALWEIDLKPGTYSITVCVGDAWWAYSTNVIQAENIQIMNDTVDSDQKWIEKTEIITVNDGRLTLSFQNSSPHSQLCWIKISSQQ